MHRSASLLRAAGRRAPLAARRPVTRAPAAASAAVASAAAARRAAPCRALSRDVVRDVDASRLEVTRVETPSTLPPKETLVFGQLFTDHMLELDWDQAEGWSAPRISPFHNLELHPAASSLHYALQCFEGLKAYKGVDGKLRLFRPDMNMARMNRSNERLYLPPFDPAEMTKLLKKFVSVERDMIPEGVGYSLYLRPTCVSTHPFLGVGAAAAARLFVIASPVGPYYKNGFAPVKLLADPSVTRAFPGGTGDVKVGGNYATGIGPQMNAAKKGYAQVLWLFGEDHVVSEVGTMNQLFFWERPDGTRELVTAPLDGTVLPGVTRDSILQLAREWGEFEVSERHYTIGEVIAAIKEGRMIEAFGCGTAAIVSPVNGISFDDVEYAIPLDRDDASATVGPLTKRFADTLQNITYGVTPHEWAVLVDEE